MDNFLLLKDSDKKVYFDVVANELDVTPQLIEKDFWVCWILKMLFSLPESGNHLTFKGGTSLSKCYNVIKRFSEDVDVSIERTFLTSQESIEPDRKQSSKENQRRLDRLKQACQEKIGDVIIPELKDKIGSALSDIVKWEIKLDSDDSDKQTILFTYPSIIDNSTNNYIQPVVKIELGARSDHWPVEVMSVKPYVSNAAGKVTIEGTQVRVLGAERTFWEKATILHAISNGSKLRTRMSRHYYDVGEMVGSPIYGKAIQNIDLLIKVAEHKALFFKDSKARYDLAKPGSLRLMPQNEHIVQLNEDYRQMQEMFFEDPPSFESVLEKLKTAEEEINRIKQ
ncbi:MAG: nucleotidyl transferase AbiEii/AbiGii toxin family protein [Candidatus Omnitrophota bacterium]